MSLQTPWGAIKVLVGSKEYPFTAKKIISRFNCETFLITLPQITYTKPTFLYCTLNADTQKTLIDDIEQDARFLRRSIYELDENYDITAKLMITSTRQHELATFGLEQSFYMKHGLGVLLDTHFSQLNYNFCVTWLKDKHLDWREQQQFFLASCHPLCTINYLTY